MTKMMSRPARTEDRSRVVAYGLMMLTAFLVVAAIYTSSLISQRQAALREVSRYNATWLVSQAALEVGRLTAALVDRLVHHAHIVAFTGESYRLKNALSTVRTPDGI